jgi:hypothetical protein
MRKNMYWKPKPKQQNQSNKSNENPEMASVASVKPLFVFPSVNAIQFHTSLQKARGRLIILGHYTSH